MSGGDVALGGCHGKESADPHPSVDIFGGELWSRLPQQTQIGDMGGAAPSTAIPVSRDTFSVGSNFGRFRIQEVCPVVPLHVLVSGQEGSGNECPHVVLGPSDLLVPSSSSPVQGFAEGSGGVDQGHSGLSSLALGSVVVTSDRDVGGTPDASSPLQDGTEVHDRGTNPLLPGTSSGSAHFREEYGQAVAGHSLDEDDVNFLAGHLAEGSAKGYVSAFRQFEQFCLERGANPFSCGPAIVVKYLQ